MAYHGEIDHGDGVATLSAMITCRNIGDVLVKKYPGYTWMVKPYQDESAYQLFCLELSGEWGYVLHHNKIDNDYKAVVRAGGEILERYKLSRVRLKQDHLQIAPKDFTGARTFDRG